MRNFLTDGLGSTIALADSAGTIQTQYAYEPFGKTAVSGAANASTFQYTGRENDGTGLYYYRARYYNPGIGRFISEDPSGFDGGINFYTYADDDPINGKDPSGEIKVWGNWCGPNWTGGRSESYDPSHDKLYKAPKDDVDSVCKAHDAEQALR